MEPIAQPTVTALAAIGVVLGLIILWRGLAGYRSEVRVADTSTSTISAIAAGEVRITGVVETAELTLVSLLQSQPCVYYRATVGDGGHQSTPESGFTDERSIGFRVRDASGSLRIFPRDGRFDVPVRFEGETSLLGDEPAGLDVRQGGSTTWSEPDRASAIATLLQVQDGERDVLPWLRDGRGRRSYREARLEIGDPVTIVGRALPFADLSDPEMADTASGSAIPVDDPEVAADIATARAAGTLADDVETAWGNAAIAGFGIGRPVSAPTIDPAATPLPPAEEGAAVEVARRFEIAPETLVVAASHEVPLLVAFGTPGTVVARGRQRFAVGLLGALLAIASAMVLAFSVSGGVAT